MGGAAIAGASNRRQRVPDSALPFYLSSWRPFVCWLGSYTRLVSLQRLPLRGACCPPGASTATPNGRDFTWDASLARRRRGVALDSVYSLSCPFIHRKGPWLRAAHFQSTNPVVTRRRWTPGAPFGTVAAFTLFSHLGRARAVPVRCCNHSGLASLQSW